MPAMTQLTTLRPFFGGDWHDGDDAVETVFDKYSDAAATDVQTSSRAQVDALIGAAVAGQERTRLSQHDRYRILSTASRLILERRDELIETVALDTGFVHADAVKEVDRTAETLQLSAEEARRLAGEVVPLAGAAGLEGRLAYTRLDPLGVVCAITPFNSPLNTVAHKVGPALAAGNGVILKPASLTPRAADALLRVLLDAGLPPELISVVYGGGSTVGQWLAEDPRPAFYAFTGSTRVGEALHQTVGLRRTQLEMGSLASTIICADADLDRAATLAMNASFRKSGQVCTSVQRLYVHRSVVDEVAARIAGGLAGKTAGDPADRDAYVGPLIAPKEAVRVRTWIDEAIDRGAELVAGGTQLGNVIAPTVLADVAPDASVMTREIFGPVVVLRPFDELGEAIADVNDTPYGLAAGVFTSDIGAAMTAAEQLRMGSVHINETSSSRVDLMPFAGVKQSGFGGAEGPRYAVREMSEQRVITIGRP